MNEPGDKVKSVLFLPPHPERKGKEKGDCGLKGILKEVDPKNCTTSLVKISKTKRNPMGKRGSYSLEFKTPPKGIPMTENLV